jgi:hypothetical protein
MKYNSLNELKDGITTLVNPKNIFDKNESCIIVFFLQSNEILIEIKTNIIGDTENTLFLNIYNWMDKNNRCNNTVYIVLPQDFERFSPVFISTLYLFNQGIGSSFVIIGHKNNSRTYEFTHLAHSGLLSQDNLNFFKVGAYTVESSQLLWFSTRNTESVDK